VCKVSQIWDDVARFVNYVLRPICPDDFSDTEIAWLHHILRNRKLVSTYGKLKEFLSNVEEQEKRFYRSPDQKVIQVDKRKRQSSSNRSKKRFHDDTKLVEILLPGKYVSGICEPVLLIAEYDGNLDKILERYSLEEFRKQCSERIRKLSG
jgi:hypothetical protein